MLLRVFALLLVALPVFGQQLPVRWEELVASDWAKALELSKRTCILPVGILEKHGAHLPIGTDIIAAHWRAREAAKREYAVVFPEYFYGQIYEAHYSEGTFSLPPDLINTLLQATLDEISANGFKKILLISGHGGNQHWLRYFVQTQLAKRRDYVVYMLDPWNPRWGSDVGKPDPAYQEEVRKLRKTPPEGDQHGGEGETSGMLVIRPDLVKLDRASSEDGSDQKRLAHLDNLWTSTSWYARFPNHYAGQGAAGNVTLGKLTTEHSVDMLVKAIRTIKDDQVTPKIQEENYNRQEERTKTGTSKPFQK